MLQETVIAFIHVRLSGGRVILPMTEHYKTSQTVTKGQGRNNYNVFRRKHSVNSVLPNSPQLYQVKKRTWRITDKPTFDSLPEHYYLEFANPATKSSATEFQAEHSVLFMKMIVLFT